jgi:hypothetical protein
MPPDKKPEPFILLVLLKSREDWFVSTKKRSTASMTETQLLLEKSRE